MRNALSWVGVLVLVFSASGNALRAAAREPAAPQLPTSTPQLISVGEVVTGVLHATTCGDGTCIPAVEEMLFELTAPSDGTLIVELDWNLNDGSIALQVEDGVLHYWPTTVGTLPVTAGGTYQVLVYTNPWALFEIPFALTTSITSGPVVLPPSCSMAPPVSGWICIGEGWVPPDHPLAHLGVPAPSPPSGPGGASGCPTIQPAPNWVCVSPNWVPPDHPAALSAPPTPTPPAAPVAPGGCTTPDPFAGIPGLVGVCLGENTWVPMSHPLARGGG